MNELRLVKDGAVVGNWPVNDIHNINAFRRVYDVSDTIPIQSPWTAEEAAVLLKLSKHDWQLILNKYLDEHYKKGSDWWLTEYLHELISLSLAHSKSGLSLEQFIGEMKRCNTEKSQ